MTNRKVDVQRAVIAAFENATAPLSMFELNAFVIQELGCDVSASALHNAVVRLMWDKSVVRVDKDARSPSGKGARGYRYQLSAAAARSESPSDGRATRGR